jgi:archaellum component FlaC
MKEILDRLTEMGQDIKGIKTDVAELKTDVAELKTRMGNLESSVEQIKTRQEVIVEQTAGLMEFRTETKGILEELQEDQLSISHILGEHEIDIRGLRRRLA